MIWQEKRVFERISHLYSWSSPSKGRESLRKKIITFRIIFFFYFLPNWNKKQQRWMENWVNVIQTIIYFSSFRHIFSREWCSWCWGWRMSIILLLLLQLPPIWHFFFSFSFSIISLLKIQICSIFLWALSSVWFHYVKILLFHVFSPHALQIQFGILLFWGTKEYIGKRERKNLILWNIFKNISRIKIFFH